jgi:hypothetical protein
MLTPFGVVWKLNVLLTYMCLICILIYVIESDVSSCPGPRRDSSSKQICELCPSRILKSIATRPYKAGRACEKHFSLATKRGISVEEAATSTASSTAIESSAPKPIRKRKLQVEIDDSQGEEQTTQIFSPHQLRVRPDKPAFPDKKKQKMLEAAAIMAQLDATHAARLASMEQSITSPRSPPPIPSKPKQAASIKLSFDD